MNPDPALVELTDLWYRLPGLVGDAWPELRPRLLAAVEEVATAPPEEYERRARALLGLLRGHAEVRRRLAPALIGRTIPTDRSADSGAGTGGRPALELARRAGIVLPGDENPAGRWLTAEAESAEAEHPGSWSLAFAVAEAPGRAAAAAPLGDLGGPVTLTVEVASTDAQVDVRTDTLTVPRQGPSPDRAHFLVTPARSGPVQVLALFRRDGNLVQWMTVNLGEQGVRARTQGLTRTAATEVRERGLTIQVLRGLTGHQLVVSGFGQACRAALTLKDRDLDDIARQVREPLRALADACARTSDTSPWPGPSLAEDVFERHTRLLAEAGCRMFRRLFFDGDAQLEAVGRQIERYLAADAPRSVQFITEEPLLPWHLMCPVEHLRDADVRHILGLRHEVDCVPLVPNATRAVTEVAIDTGPGVNVTLGLNRSIDRGGERDLVAKQEAYWRGYVEKGLVGLTVQDEHRSVLETLCGYGSPAEIVYLYCHATAHDPDDDGPEHARLTVEGTDGGILLRSLHDSGGALPGPPVIVLNACGTTFASSLSTLSFLTHFLARSRGVLGTEADIPAPFAAAWATAFFDRLLAGERIGAAVRATREHFVTEHRNPLGLLYALYCNGDTVLRPAIGPLPERPVSAPVPAS
ncbi:CHAT domain-containing protein [Streptomyces sp. NPDC006458]|uniref:CHAT domain-containing protein n=1 Tax=Streptomyces sp. NPDC006458 TaxID=3154302 RepID=UPI0033AE5644